MRNTFEQCREQFMIARNNNNWNDTVVWATELLKYDDKLAFVWASRGLGLAMMQFHLDAILNYDRAIALQTDKEELAALYSNRGAALFDLDKSKSDEALRDLDKAIDLAPLAQPHVTKANVLKHKGHLQKAIASYRQAVALSPDYADAHFMLGMALLKSKALQEGWKEYAWRWKTGQLPERKTKAPKWDGEDLTNKTLLLYGEQGLGDIIQFARYARVIGTQFPSVRIIVEGRPVLKRLLETILEVRSVINAGDQVPKVDYAISMLDLAGKLTPNIGAIPSTRREYYIRKSDVAVWNMRLQPLFERNPGALKVGICWSGLARPDQPNANAVDQVRSTDLSMFAHLAAIPDILWVSLQKGPPAAQVKSPPVGMTIGDFTEDMHDFYETCAAIENLDLVISVDTAVLHAAASLGKNTWLLSRWDGCWRWFGDLSVTPWYPSVRQFVQPKFGDWEGLMLNVADALRDHKKGLGK